MTELIDFPKLPPGAVIRPDCHPIEGHYFETRAGALYPSEPSDRLIIGYTLAGQWEEAFWNAQNNEDAQEAAKIEIQWRAWARGKEWK